MELLAPAGNPEKLKIAFAYGADAVYLGGPKFGLRKHADNFTLEEMDQGVQWANQRGKQVYVVLNGFAHHHDMAELPDYLAALQRIQPHALIISDMGIFQLARHQTTIPLHVSTQASVTNRWACQVWKEAGAKRVILAREVSIDEAIEIKKHLDIELEVFIHGAMCASYSGKCVISNYTSGRDSNRGGCVQSCRHSFNLVEKTTQKPYYSGHIMNAKDLAAIRLIPRLKASGIESLKIEGRMKSNLYVANAVSAYRKAIQRVESTGTLTENDIQALEDQLALVSNRTFSSGGLHHRPEGQSIRYEDSAYTRSVDYVGTIKASIPNQGLWLELKTHLHKNDILDILKPNGEIVPLSIQDMQTLSGQPLETAPANMVVKLPWIKDIQPYTVVRKGLKKASAPSAFTSQ